ncbi:MAG: hypothetical protein JNK05_07810 [Myxococcales bacterium]|nr:hypothetical protein [Myxococcales bacterium]
MKMTLSRTVSTIAALGLFAHCARSTPPVAWTNPEPETFSFEATTVKRTDTAAPAAETAAATPAADSDAGAATPAGDSDAGAPSAGASATPAASSAGAPDSAARAAVRAALDAQHAALAHCYDEILSTAPEAAGRVNVEFAVSNANAVTRLDVRVEGEGGLAQARACIETAMRAVTFTGMPATGGVVRRSYSFVNPPIELTIAQPLEVRSRPAAAAAAAASAEAAHGVLTDAEVRNQLSVALPAMQACYATALRRARTAAGAGDMRVTLRPNGEVEAAAWSSSVEPIALMGDCLGAAVRAQRFRNSGTGATVRASVTFAR